ncbi:glutathione S-transferase family protein [Frigidibacter sp. RF13]|uniref:glutathione S-transferase family protein n=1 Tax=Frigidibacter sp. RF13 TaxID=2997340 RepID=UPI002271BBC1|nr:glutathione S-transferase family protein [Frigidibacter sp. RF13]MCY1128233.1 glutathione S-transferase family protein [Frigidibacter sp. RF13]
MPDADMPILFTYEWVPDFPRGYVRDLRIRWLFHEMGQPYRVETVTFAPKRADHLAMQPFGQVPAVRWRGRSWFETGAMLLGLASGHPTLLPEDRRADITEWLFAAANSVEMSTQPWILANASLAAPQIFGPAPASEVIERFAQRMKSKLGAMETVLTNRDWLAGGFTIADILMADVLRITGDKGGLEGYPVLQSYVARATARPAFLKAHADQMAHWHAADATRAAVA